MRKSDVQQRWERGTRAAGERAMTREQLARDVARQAERAWFANLDSCTCAGGIGPDGRVWSDSSRCLKHARRRDDDRD